MIDPIAWFKGKRVLPRWKLAVMVIVGIWIGWSIGTDQFPFAVFLGLLAISDLTTRNSDR
jgi:antibiotic biosynthesis monooxygenase (ABM) superfamily enzyme